ncbi:neural cell adhesion molecule 1-like [Eriocheir sinensis]|uniref:neural cell adhesion molecule 1-like n=1 Tax=Eriocheir sinensis TaxID=95602 RepID=UPI0021C85CE3|nr:neural cell adhesion molecule 1-like [Eriocheir sinensis]
MITWQLTTLLWAAIGLRHTTRASPNLGTITAPLHPPPPSLPAPTPPPTRPPVPREQLYEAAEDMWAKALALNTLAPEFQGQNNTEILAQVGGEATLSCYTYHLSDERVAWLKKDDDQLLTVGQEVYAAEQRFSVVHTNHDEAWELWVKDVALSDAGQYECQLTTNPTVSFFFTLVVTQAEAVVTGPGEVHIEEGSHLSLECQVKNAPVPPVYIFWYHNNTMVNYARQHHLQVDHQNYTSTLVVARVRRTDAGTYSCQPHLAAPANVTVHVVTGERPAAMQHGDTHEEGSTVTSGQVDTGALNLPVLVTSSGLVMLVWGQVAGVGGMR